MQCLKAWAGVVLVILSTGVKAAQDHEGGLYFSHQDWEVACDNTGTCRAAGYQGYGDHKPVTVLLTRAAGPRAPVTGKLRIGELNLDAEVMETLASDSRLWLHVDGERIGPADIDPDSLTADLQAHEVDSVISALKRDTLIEWVLGEHHWRLSDDGATAVLLKMDDVQGRIDTPGAVVRKGSRNERDVPPAKPVPVLIAPPVATMVESDTLLKAAQIPALKAALRDATEGDDECIGLVGPKKDAQALRAVRLSTTRLLVSTTCWAAAYNFGSGYWVINEAPPYEPVLITQSGSYFEDGMISAAHKGRGLGDCWSRDEWTWNGQRFVHTASLSTGKCRLVAAGGAWTLPTLVTEVIRERREPASRP